MPNQARIATIRERLQAAFQPTHLEVIDDSAKHIGHAGSKDGGGHFTLFIAAECFKSKSRIDTHREIYLVLNDMIPTEIHALVINVES